MSTSDFLEVMPIEVAPFPRFSFLPPEIREMIWRMSVAPRIVYLKMVTDKRRTCSRVWSETSIDGPGSMGFFDLDNQSEAAREDQGPDPPYRFASQSIPTLFFVCKESYLVAEKIYTKSFGSDYAPPSTWFNFELDTLYLDWGCQIELYFDHYNDDEDEDDENISTSFIFQPDSFSDDVKKVRNLAIYNGMYPGGILVDRWIAYVLRCFTSVQSLTLATPLLDRNDSTDFVFLGQSDCAESTEYQSLEGLDAGFHPTILSSFPKLEQSGDLPCFWQPSDWLWSRYPFSSGWELHTSMASKLPKPNKPELHFTIITTQQQKDILLRRKQEYNRERDAQREPITITARNYDPLEVSVPLSTTIFGLVSMFCQANDIDAVVNSDTVSVFDTTIAAWITRVLLKNRLYDYFYCGIIRNLEIIFEDSEGQHECSCPYFAKQNEMAWMEFEDFGLRALFESQEELE